MAANIDETKGYIKIPQSAVSDLSLPFTVTVKFPDRSSNPYTITQLPWLLSNLEQAGDYYFLIKDANGVLREKYIYLPAIDCGNQNNFQSTSQEADCTDTDVDVTPNDMLTAGFGITNSEIVSGQGTLASNTSKTLFTYNPPNEVYSGTVVIEFTATDGNEVRKKRHTLTIGCPSAPPSDDAPAVQSQAYCTSGPVDVTPDLPEGWTLVQITFPNGQLQYGSVNPSQFPQIVYAPDAIEREGQVVENFGYLAQNPNGVEKEGAIEVTIGCPLPVAPTLNISMLCDQSSIPIFQNVIQQVYDANISNIHVQSVTGASNGSVTYIPGQTSQGRGYQYNLSNTNAETDQLTYTITDGVNEPVTGIINVTIVAAENCGEGGGGIINPIVVKTCDGIVYIPLAIPEGYVLQGFSHDNLQHGEQYGTLEQDNSGQYNFDPSDTFGADYTFNYTVRNIETSETLVSTITVKYECDPCDVAITAKYCPSGFTRSVVGLKLDQNGNFYYDNDDTLAFYPGVPNDGSQNFATVETEVLSGQGHTVINNNPLEFKLAGIGDFIRFRYRAVSSCSGFTSEWKILKTTRNESSHGFSNEFFDSNDNPNSDGTLYYPPFVKIVLPEDAPVVTLAAFALEDPQNPNATQSIELLNENGNPAGLGSDVTLDVNTLQTQHINGNGGKLYGYIMVEGCETPIKTQVLDVPPFMGLPFDA